MTLSSDRRTAYTCGALTGAASTVALVAARRGRRWRAILAAVVALACGALAVAFEERAQAE